MADRITDDTSQRFHDFQAELREARDAFSKQSEEAQEARRFLAGKHYSPEEEAILKSEQRPALVFNQYGQLVSVVSGTEISNRYEPHYLPRTLEDQGGADVFNEMVRYFRNESDAAHEESLAFRDCLNEGVGVTEIFLDKSEDPNGRIKTVRVNPDDILWDAAAERPNAIDKKWIVRAKWLDAEQFRAMWPDQADMFFESVLDSNEVGKLREKPIDVVDVRQSWLYNSDADFYDPHKDRVLVLERQYWQYEPGFVMRDFQSGILQFITEEEAQQVMMQLPQLQMQGIPTEQILMQKQEKRFKREFWAGSTLLSEGDNPINRFTYNLITGYQDLSEDQILYYGLFRAAKDPQYWANKFLSQVIHILSSSPKGGFAYEVGAFVNKNKAANELAKPRAFIELTPGSIANKKIMQLDPAQLPPGAFQMADYALNAIPRVLGINPYLGGQADDLKRTPAQSIQAIIRQGLVSLAPMFDALKLYRKQVGRCYMEFIKNHIEPGLSVRVVGQPTAQFVQFTQDMAFMNYDVVVEETPITPTNMMELWTTLTDQGLLQRMVELGIPVPPSIINIIPGLPQYIKDEWMQMIQQMMQQPAGPGQGA